MKNPKLLDNKKLIIAYRVWWIMWHKRIDQYGAIAYKPDARLIKLKRECDRRGLSVAPLNVPEPSTDEEE